MTERRHDRWDREGGRRVPSERGDGSEGKQWERPQRRLPDPEFESTTWSRGQQVRERRDFGGEQVRERRDFGEEQVPERRDSRGEQVQRGLLRKEEPRRLEQREEPRLERREIPPWGPRSTEVSGRGGPSSRGFNDHRGRGGLHVGSHRGGNRFHANRASADGSDRERRPAVKREDWNFWILLCGAADSQVVFTDYKGFCPRDNQRDYIERGWMKVPLFQPARDDEIHERFREKLQSIASAVAQCEELDNEKCQLFAHVRVGDMFLFHKYFQFDQRPGPKLEDLNLLLEKESFPIARERLDRFFRYNDTERRHMTTTFVTEKFCGSHATIEVCLSLHDFSLEPNEEFILTVTLNGDKYKFELIYGLGDLRLQRILLFTHKWNLNLVTGKGTNYQGTFKEKADLRLQIDASFCGETDEKINACLAEESLSLEALQQLFERVSETDKSSVPPFIADVPLVSSEGSPRLYRLKLPELAPRLDYFREQYNRKFLKRHDRWPLLVCLRQFKFYKLDQDSAEMFAGKEGVELRVCAELDHPLGREVLEEPEFETHLWDACQLMQELVATSLEA